MFSLIHKTKITIKNLPVQWIPKIELYYPDLPQFPIMYIHFHLKDERIIACPVAVNYDISDDKCTAEFFVLINTNPTKEVISKLKDELENRIGFSNRITKKTVIECCKGNHNYQNLLCDLWQYIEKSYGSSIPYGRLYEEIYSIPRFVAAWQPKTGRQSEMRMLYNFMSSFGEEVNFPSNWSHLEFYVIPNYKDVQNKNYQEFPIFKKLYDSIKRLFDLEFNKTINIDGKRFNVMNKAWKQNKQDFMTFVSGYYYSTGQLTETEKLYVDKLVDAFNRHAWRAAYFISAFLTIDTSDYKTWSKSFFKNYYDSGSKLKGYSEKVVACFLQQGFANDEIIPIDTWIETFYQFPLGISSRSQFYDNFTMLGKLERVIWLASQSNKTNMRNFFNILWCQRYGTIGNGILRGINPIACSLCKLKTTCVGLLQKAQESIFLTETPPNNNCQFIDVPDTVSFVCLLEEKVPKKIYKKEKNNWILVDEFSGYLMTSKNKLSNETIDCKTIMLQDFISLF